MSIQEHLNKIRNAIYGREVRESIAKGIETAYDDASEKDNANMEVKIARGTHPNLRSRLEEVDNKQQQTTAQLTQTIPKNSGAVQPSDLSQEVKEQMTGGSVAVVGKDAILEENVVDNQITPRKTNFATWSRNLYNKETSNDYISLTGSSLINTTTDYVAVKPATKYVVNKETRLILYNQDYQPIGGQHLLGVDENVETSNSTRYVRLSILMSDKDDYQFEEGTVPTSYQPYGILIPDLAIENNGLESYLTTQDEGWVI